MLIWIAALSVLVCGAGMVACSRLTRKKETSFIGHVLVIVLAVLMALSMTYLVLAGLFFGSWG